jgi:glyoxylase-like metal-dependent hydrolase (beta-lactamase superfamily II)
MKLLTLPLGDYQTNCYILFDSTQEAIIIDPGFEANKIIALLQSHDLSIKYIIITHGHGDHIGAIPELKRHYPEAKVVISDQDAYRLGNPRLSLLSMMGSQAIIEADQTVKDGDYITMGSLKLKVIATPGHTEGGISLLIDNCVFVGDTLFQGDIGRTDLSGGDFETLENSIRHKLYTLPDYTIVYPGHGPATSIAFEKSNNSYFRQSNQE